MRPAATGLATALVAAVALTVFAAPPAPSEPPPSGPPAAPAETAGHEHHEWSPADMALLAADAGLLAALLVLLGGRSRVRRPGPGWVLREESAAVTRTGHEGEGA